MANYLIDSDSVIRYLKDVHRMTDVVAVNPKAGGGFQFFTGLYRSEKVFVKCRPNVPDTEFKVNGILYSVNPENFLKPVFFDDNGEFTVSAFEYFDGKTLFDLLEEKRMTDAMRVAAVRQMADIAATLADVQIVHRDIHIVQFMMNADMRLVLFDFNLAAPAESSGNRYDGFIRPEVFLRNWPQKPAVELWDDIPFFLKTIDWLKPLPEECLPYVKAIENRLGTNVYVQKNLFYHKARRLLMRPLVRICAGLIPFKAARRNFRSKYFDLF